ncbi:MAG: hypothetical protein LBJ48_00135 [Coriobacteriales bacterium]|jgi:hypothetical protein|nr:hypothetical protein [Coriobacteriales bacterium]
MRNKVIAIGEHASKVVEEIENRYIYKMARGQKGVPLEIPMIKQVSPFLCKFDILSVVDADTDFIRINEVSILNGCWRANFTAMALEQGKALIGDNVFFVIARGDDEAMSTVSHSVKSKKMKGKELVVCFLLDYSTAQAQIEGESAACEARLAEEIDALVVVPVNGLADFSQIKSLTEDSNNAKWRAAREAGKDSITVTTSPFHDEKSAAAYAIWIFLQAVSKSDESLNSMSDGIKTAINDLGIVHLALKMSLMDCKNEFVVENAIRNLCDKTDSSTVNHSLAIIASVNTCMSAYTGAVIGASMDPTNLEFAFECVFDDILKDWLVVVYVVA